MDIILSILCGAPKGSWESRARYGRSHCAYCCENTLHLKGSWLLPQYLAQPGYDIAVASSVVEGVVPRLVRRNEKASMLEVFNETQVMLLALLAQSTISVKHCVRLVAPELTVYNASNAGKI